MTQMALEVMCYLRECLSMIFFFFTFKSMCIQSCGNSFIYLSISFKRQVTEAYKISKKKMLNPDLEKVILTVELDEARGEGIALNVCMCVFKRGLS